MRSLPWPRTRRIPRSTVLRHHRHTYLQGPAPSANTVISSTDNPKADSIRWPRILRLYAPIATIGLAASLTYHYYSKDPPSNTEPPNLRPIHPHLQRARLHHKQPLHSPPHKRRWCRQRSHLRVSMAKGHVERTDQATPAPDRAGLYTASTAGT